MIEMVSATVERLVSALLLDVKAGKDMPECSRMEWLTASLLGKPTCLFKKIITISLESWLTITIYFKKLFAFIIEDSYICQNIQIKSYSKNVVNTED